MLEYNSIRSPLGQPRNAILGHTFSALIGVSISKLFQLHPDYDSVRWIAGAISCGCASAVMLLTGTVHPPGGASAVLAATEPAVTAMGWYFVGLVMWGTTLMLLVGLVINNIQRQFPLYWWTPLDLRKAKRGDEEAVPDAKGGLERRETEEQQRYDGEEEIKINGAEVMLPDDLSLNREEAEVLEKLQRRLRTRADDRRGSEEQGGEKTGLDSGRSSAEVTMVPTRSDVGGEARSNSAISRSGI